MAAPASIAVVHLVRAANGLVPLQQFLESYARHPAGIDHELVIVFKGFAGDGACDGPRALLASFPHQELFIDDRGMDLHAFGFAARQLTHPCLCLVNSFSVLLDSGWLEKMQAILARPQVGIVGTSGSYESNYTNLVQRQLRKNDHRLHVRLRNALKRFGLARAYGPFPNPHLRSNGFLISRRVMQSVWPVCISSKEQAYRFESGKHSLTRRIEALQLQVFITGKDACAYAVPDWRQSNTFRMADQGNLLIGDNQTRRYEQAEAPEKSSLNRQAWEDPQSAGDPGNPAQGN